jgi:hypothetical protein
VIKRVYSSCLILYLNNEFSRFRYQSQEEIIAAANEFLPVHLICEFDFGSLSWDFLDAKENTFDSMDGLDLTWDAIDTHI